MSEPVDVIIRTVGEPDRRDLLERAIRSAAGQEGVVARPVVVVAGEHPEAIVEFASGLGAAVHTVGQHASPGQALGIGRGLIGARFFAFLDDDDEFLARALRTRLDVMQDEPAADLVVTNGNWVSAGQRSIHIPDIARHQDDPLKGIIERCWLPSCGGLFRASTVPALFFERLPDLCEWTLLAFRLALNRSRIRFLDLPTYNVYDTPGSLSKGSDFLQATLDVLDRMRAERLPPAEHARLDAKYRAALHNAAERYRQGGNLRMAWRCHLKSLKPPGILRHGAYTRKLLWNGGYARAARGTLSR